MIRDTYAATAQDLLNAMAKKMDTEIVNQLSELVKRGVLVIQSTQPVLVQELNDMTGETEIKLSAAISLVPKELEYIQKLEAEIVELKRVVESLKDELQYADYGEDL